MKKSKYKDGKITEKRFRRLTINNKAKRNILIETYIWILNGKYYVSGTLDNLSVGKNSGVASNDCYRFS